MKRQSYYQKHHRSDRERLASVFTGEDDTPEIKGMESFCHEGPYCRVCHDSMALFDYLLSIDHAHGLIMEERVLSDNLLHHLATAGPDLSTFQWLILKQAYAGTQHSEEGEVILFNDFSAFFKNPGWQHLQRLAIIQQEFTDKDLSLLSQCPYLSNLEELILTSNQITDQGIQVLAASPIAPQLKYLDLSSNRIGQEGLDQLLWSNDFPQLQELFLRDCQARYFNSHKMLPKSFQRLHLSGITIHLESLLRFQANHPQLDFQAGILPNGYPSQIANWFTPKETQDFVGWVGGG